MNFLTPLRREEQLHCRRVSAVSAYLAEIASLSSPEVDAIAQSALFHDVGKAALPQDILYKPGPLSPNERPLILAHTILGQKMLKGMDTLLSTAAVVAQQHHEHLDGSGYLGLHDSEIHPHAKLIAVANAFDTLSFRKEVWDQEQVRCELERRAGPQLEPRTVAMLLDSLPQIVDICHHVNAHCG